MGLEKWLGGLRAAVRRASRRSVFRSQHMSRDSQLPETPALGGSGAHFWSLQVHTHMVDIFIGAPIHVYINALKVTLTLLVLVLRIK